MIRELIIYLTIIVLISIVITPVVLVILEIIAYLISRLFVKIGIVEIRIKSDKYSTSKPNQNTYTSNKNIYPPDNVCSFSKFIINQYCVKFIPFVRTRYNKHLCNYNADIIINELRESTKQELINSVSHADNISHDKTDNNPN
jgi:hypothetical protein